MLRLERAPLRSFLAAPLGRCHIARSLLVACPTPDLRLCIVWGRPDAQDARDLVELLHVGSDRKMTAPYDALTDVRRMTRVDPRAFYALVTGLVAHRATFARHVRRQAFVRPATLVGAVVGGLYDVVGWTFPVHTFAELGPALAWLGRADADDLAQWIDATLAGEREHLLDDVASALELDPRVSLAALARSLRTSSRQLQKRLQAAGTTFRRELNDVRVRVAQKLLLDEQLKISAIAEDVGIKSLRRFRDLFREATGTTPGEWRKRGGQGPIG
jgi:AraC-like DNA-binding protein